ncbi:alpha/beta hydrolase [Lyngbya aestuarii]|uniref:alpha/beta hydrolase n=1 Tax=Lyngbya aestuarii TaxID=118322 RepID=UPI00058F81AA|nr:alpha/beta hydrolase [Lyngbya aestuarii]
MNKVTLKRLIIGEFSLHRLLISTIIIYACVGIWAYFGSDRLIFLPPPSSYTQTNELIQLKAANGDDITALYLPNPESQYTILYSHGNAEDIGQTRFHLQKLQEIGFSVLVYDYPGYGTSSGKPTVKGTYHAINAAYNYLTQDLNIPPHEILVYGRSVGGGPSVDLASRKPIGGLIIESSFVSIFRVVTRIPLFPFDKFSNLAKIPKVNSPILILHGNQDQVIPFWHGEKLYAKANEPKMSFWVDGADHNDVLDVAGQRYLETLKKFTELVENHHSST